MSLGPANIRILYELALAVGNGLNLYEMLRTSLSSYIKKLDCAAGMVYRLSPGNNVYTAEVIFCVPYAVHVKHTYRELENLVSSSFSDTELLKFKSALPLTGPVGKHQSYIIMNLENLGFLVLIKEGDGIRHEEVELLNDINNKLALACIECIKHEAIEESETRFQLQQGLLPQMVCEVSPGGLITYTNDYAVEKLGYSKDDLKTGFSILNIIHPADQIKFSNNLEKSINHDNPDPREYNVVKNDGTTFPAMVYTTRLIKNNKVTGLAWVMIDISEVKKNEKILKHFAERLELALLGSSAGLWDWDIETGDAFFSERWCEMLGYDISEVRPHISSWEQFVHPDDMPAITEVLTSHLENKIPLYQTEHRIRAKTGEWIWVLDTGKVTQRDDKGNALRAVGTHIDITERKHNEILKGIELDLGTKLAKAGSFEQTLKICLVSALHYSDMDCGGIYIDDESDGSFRLVQHTGISEKFVKSLCFYTSDSANAGIIMKGKPVYSTHQSLAKQNKTFKEESLKAFAIIPIVHLNRSIGCFNIASHTSEEISAFSREVLEKIALYIGSFIIQARNEDKLHQNRQDLNTLFNTIDDFLFILDMEGNMIYFNSAVKERLGYSESELVNKHVLTVHPPEKHEEATIIIQGMLAETENFCRVPLLCKDGTQIPVETKVKKGRWKGKNVFIGISRDITESKSYERQIRENAERLEMAIMAAEAGLWDWNLKTGKLILNEKWFSLRGFDNDKDNYTIDTWEKLLHPDDSEATLKALNDHLGKKTPFYQAEYRSLTKSGQYIWVLDTGKIMEFDDEGNPVRIVGTNIDITSKKEKDIILQQNFRQQELLSEIALELNSLDEFSERINSSLNKIGSHTGVSRVYIFEDNATGLTTSNTFEWCNDGVSPQIDELQGIPYEMIPSWKKILTEKGRVYSENISELPDDLRPILEPQNIKSIIVYPLSVRGAFFGFIGFDECARNKAWSKTELELLRTVSGIIANTYERKIMEKSIIDERDKANSANMAKSEFLANMSHEIRTPMNAILGFSEVLYQKLDSAQHRKMIKSVLSSGNLLLSLLNDILDLSKVESGKLEIIYQPVDLKSIMDDIKLLFYEKASANGVELSIKISDNFPSMMMLDELRIKQVFFNIVGNAVKFTKEGYIMINANFSAIDETNGDLTIEVEDSGIGIAESQKSKIFDAFVQQSGQSNRAYGGAGLGLTISKRLVEKMNGSISVSSQLFKGSVFKIFIPGIEFGQSKIMRAKTEEDFSKIIFEKAEILVVDDVSTNIEIVENLLSSTRINVTSARNGEIALELVHRRTFDLILLDLRMQGMDGFEVVKIIKADQQLYHIPVVAFTASVLNSDKIISENKFDDVIIKPVSQQDLFLLLAKYIKHRKMASKKKNKGESHVEKVEIPAHLLKKLPEINKTLQEKLLPMWEKVKDQLVLFRIEEFAAELKQFAEAYNFEFLVRYADRITEEIEVLDLEALKETIGVFSRISDDILSFSRNINNG